MGARAKEGGKKYHFAHEAVSLRRLRAKRRQVHSVRESVSTESKRPSTDDQPVVTQAPHASSTPPPSDAGRAGASKRSAERNACVSLQRASEIRRTRESIGGVASAMSTACSTFSGTVSRDARTGRGRSVISRAMTACAVFPVCGGSPVSIS